MELTVSVEPDLISGYVLQVGGRVFDNSGKSALAAITADAPSLAVMQTRVEDYKPAATTAEGGTVISAADGVVDVKGMDQAVYGEIVTFDNGAKGMVESVEPDHLGIMLFDKIEEGGRGHSGDPQRQTRRHPGGRRLPGPRHQPPGRAHRRQGPH